MTVREELQSRLPLGPAAVLEEILEQITAPADTLFNLCGVLDTLAHLLPQLQSFYDDEGIFSASVLAGLPGLVTAVARLSEVSGKEITIPLAFRRAAYSKA